MGLLGTVTWNELTSNVVGGHQRLALLDALMGHDNYLLDVAVVKLTPAQEAAANIALNNPTSQGDWDMPLLAAALKTEGLELELTGFTLTDIQLSFDDAELAGIFAPNEPMAALLDDLKQVQADSNEQDPKKAAKRTRSGGRENPAEGAGTGGNDGESGAQGAGGGRSDAARAFRKRGKEIFNVLDDTETYAVVIFRTREEREAFMVSVGVEADERYVDGGRVCERLARSPGK